MRIISQFIGQCFTDPSSQQFSASRTAFWCWVFISTPLNAWLKFMPWADWVKVLAVIAGVYGFNSTTGAYGRSTIVIDQSIGTARKAPM